MGDDKPAGPEQVSPAPLLRALGAVAKWLEATATPGAIVGGVAASILGRPRLTEDIDVLVLLEPDEWPAFIAAGRQFGFVPRTDDALDFAGTGRVLLVTHHPNDFPIDVVLGAMPLEEEIVHGASSTEIAGVTFPLSSPESIVVMKAIVVGRAASPISKASSKPENTSISTGFEGGWPTSTGRWTKPICSTNSIVSWPASVDRRPSAVPRSNAGRKSNAGRPGGPGPGGRQAPARVAPPERGSSLRGGVEWGVGSIARPR